MHARTKVTVHAYAIVMLRSRTMVVVHTLYDGHGNYGVSGIRDLKAGSCSETWGRVHDPETLGRDHDPSLRSGL